MTSSLVASLSLLVASSLTSSIFSSGAPEDFEAFRIVSDLDFERVEKSLSSSLAKEVVISIAPGEYTLDDTFHINRSNVSLFGEGKVLLRLADNVNKPVVSLGSLKSYPVEEDTIANLVIISIEIDGNKDAQSSELNLELPWIRNNGIDVRAVRGLRLENVASNNNRSGGFVISWGCTDIYAVSCSFERNYFDGMAYYDSRRVYSIDCNTSNNRSAGISLDNNLVDCLFLRCSIENNGDVGVFARFSSGLLFENCTVKNSGDWAFFLAHDDTGNGIHDSVISGCKVTGNRGGVRMASIDDQQSSNNQVSSTQFEANEIEGRRNVDSCGATIEEIERFDMISRIQEMERSRDSIVGSDFSSAVSSENWL